MATGVFDGATESEIKDMLEIADLPTSGQINLFDGTTGEMFEDEALRRELGALAGEDGETVIREVLQRGLDFGAGTPIPDDINLVALTRT